MMFQDLTLYLQLLRVKSVRRDICEGGCIGQENAEIHFAQM